LGDDCLKSGHNLGVSPWVDLAQRLVELDLAIEGLDAWATRPDDLHDLRELEALRDQLRAAIGRHYIPQAVRERLQDHDHSSGLSPATIDPRD